MAALQLGSTLAHSAGHSNAPPMGGSAPRYHAIGRAATLGAFALLCGLALGSNRPLWAAGPRPARPNPLQATTSHAARQSAVRSIPVDQLDADARAKVGSVLSNVSIFRRMPVRVIDCDPNLYLFLVRHPDVIVNIWEVLKISTLKLRQLGPDTYRVAEAVGTLATVEYLYRSHDTHVIYAEGSYHGPLFARPVKGRALLILKSGYVREPDGRYYITTRLDTFVRVEHGGAELLTKTFHPLMGKTADVNFVQTVAFLGSLSRTAEVNSRGVQRLAASLTHVQGEFRQRLAELVADIARKSTAKSAGTKSPPVRVASGTATK